MKIIQITASYKPAYIYGGPIQSVSKLCEAINQLVLNQNLLVDLQVLTTTANGKHELPVKSGKPVSVDGVTVTYFNRQTKDHSHLSLNLLWQLRKIILHHKQDSVLIHIHGWWNLVSILSCLIARWYRQPVILSPRGMLSTYSQHNRHAIGKRWMHGLIGKKLLSYCTIHATSEQEKTEVSKFVLTDQIRVIPNLVNQPQQEQLLTASSDDNIFKLIFLSRIEEKKGLDLLFEALASANISWRLTIAGSGEPDYVNALHKKAKHLNIDDHIVWLGQINDQQKYQIMAAHDLLVLTSYNENFANVVIESLSAGTAVLLSDQVGLADYVRSKQLGWICTLTVADIQDQLYDSFSNHVKRQQIRQNAATIIHSDFDDKFLAKKYLAFYRSALEQVNKEIKCQKSV